MDTKQAPATKPIEIFKPGSFVAMDGTRHNFTADHVADMAAGYDPKLSDAPYVVGHPKTTSPRFGHASRLFVNDAGVLCADSADVVPEFAEAVKARQYPKVSASIYLPNSPGNPTPGKHYIRHIGFLGGAAPAVKGLASVEFSEAEDGVADFAYEDRLIARILRNMRDMLIDLVGKEKADAAIPSWDIETLEASVTRDEIKTESDMRLQPGFSEPNPQENDLSTPEQLQALEAREKDVAAREAALHEGQIKLKKAGHADFAEALVTEGKLLPAHKDVVVAIIGQLDEAATVADFAEGTENHGKTGAELFKSLLQANPKIVEFGRVSATGGPEAGTADFAAPPGSEVDQEGLQKLAKAQAYMAANPGVEFMAAVAAIEQQQA